MFAKLKHVAIVSANYALVGRFYEAAFKMRVSGRARPESAVVVGDGYVGLNINPRRAGRQAGFDHFGFEVEDVEPVFARLREKYPAIQVLKRPGNRPFAGITTHDPAGNVFDLSQKGMENRTDVYEDREWQQERYIDHIALRTVMPEALAQFYVDVFGHRAARAGSLGLQSGERRGFQEGAGGLDGTEPHLTPSPVGAGPEGEARLRLFAKCPFGKHQLADPDGVLIDVSD